MLTKLKCDQNWNVTKTDQLIQGKCNHNGSFRTVTKTEMSAKQKCQQNRYITENWNVTKTEIYKTEMSPEQKCNKNLI